MIYIGPKKVRTPIVTEDVDTFEINTLRTCFGILTFRDFRRLAPAWFELRCRYLVISKATVQTSKHLNRFSRFELVYGKYLRPSGMLSGVRRMSILKYVT
jgi:hypothetical protein